MQICPKSRFSMWVCVSILLLGLLLSGTEGRAGNQVLVSAGTSPDELGLSGTSLERVKTALKDLPDGYALELEIQVRSRAVTGYETDVRYVSRITIVDADGQPDGEERIFPNWYQPPTRITQYRSGVRDGVERMYDSAGQRLEVEIPWSEGVIQGVRRSYHPDGSVQTETPFVDGVIEGESRTFDAEGRVLRIAPFQAGRRHGTSIDFWAESEEGQVQRKIPYQEGLVHGEAKAFYLDGTPQWVRPFRENRLHGVERHFDGEGVETRVIYWLNDERVSREAWEQAQQDAE